MLEELFFSVKMVKTIEHFILHEDWEQNQKDLCEILEIYPNSMNKILERLIEFNIISLTRKVASSIFYKVNKDSNLFIPLRILIQRFNIRIIKECQEDYKKSNMRNEDDN